MTPRQRSPSAAQLRERARENQALLDTLLVGIVFVRNRVMLRCNRHFEEIFGYGPNELDGLSTRVLYPDDAGFAHGATPYPLMAQGQVHEREQVLVRQDGSTFWCRLYGRAMDASQPMSGSVWLFEDVSERKAEELAMRGLLLEQAAILENASAGIVFLKDRVVQRCNRRFAEMLGYDDEDVCGRSTRFMYMSQEAFERGASAYPTLARGESHSREEQLQRRDGHPLWCRLTGRAVDPAHPELESVWLVEDVTEQRAARQELEHRVRQRTAELAEANARLRAEIAEREQVEQRMRHLANHDELTGLPNRRLLLDRLAQAITLARRSGDQLAVLFMDLDRFKTINDSLGHTVGDELLRTVAQRIVATVREGDTVARIGGDEFVLLLPRIDTGPHASRVAGKVMEALSQPLHVEGQDLRVTGSIGIAVFPHDGSTADLLLRNADAAMYHAKETGRDNQQFFASAMNVAAAQRLSLENDLHLALERGELLLHYQPRIDLGAARLVGVEALLRWQHPVRGVLHPGGFITVAEETGLISRLGEWVLREACRQQLAWRAAGVPEFPIAVNLSPRQFRERDIAERIGHVLQETSVPPALLELEITETTLMQQTEQTLATLNRLSRMGLRMAIDDFGIGYSSLSYLKRFPVDQLKIDQSFVRDVGRDPANAAIVATIATLARHLKLEVVAEGVETAEQLEGVRACGCGQAQGYLFSGAVPGDQVPAMAGRHWPVEV